jgi:molybdenum ABC transporter molybdate-binding protein
MMKYRSPTSLMNSKRTISRISITTDRPSTPRAFILRGWMVMLAIAALIAALVWMLREQTPASENLMVYCAAGIRLPVEEIAAAYKKEVGGEVQFQYEGSQTLLTKLRVAKIGDLFIAADESYTQSAKEMGLLAETIPLAVQHPVIAVKKGNPKNIRTIEDLLRTDVALADPKMASIGRTVKVLLEKTGQWQRLEKHTKVFKGTVNDVANDVIIGAVDAGIVWDATARQYPDLEMVAVPMFERARETVTIGLLTSSKKSPSALRFARFLAARDRGQPIFRKFGFETVEGDTWAVTPELKFFSGTVNRPAIEETIQQFEQREGVKVARVFNGCGALLTSIRATGAPDAYLTCDVSFATPLADLMEGDPRIVSETGLVILVAKGNPKGIRTLADLAAPGLKVGLANAEFSTLGELTRRLLADAGIAEQVKKNIMSHVPTGDLLVNQMRVGTLDAVIVYEANAVPAKECDTVPLKAVAAVQTFSVGKTSSNKQLAARLLDAIESQESRKRYEAAGFRWRPAPSTMTSH